MTIVAQQHPTPERLGRWDGIAGQMLGVGNYSAPPCTPIIHPEPPHPLSHQHNLHPPTITFPNERLLDNQQNQTINHRPYDITSKIDGTPYDPWPDGWGHSPTEITEDTLRLFFKNPDGIISSSGKVCPKLMTGLQGMADQNKNDRSRVAWKGGCLRGVYGTPTLSINGVVSEEAASWNMTRWLDYRL